MLTCSEGFLDYLQLKLFSAKGADTGSTCTRGACIGDSYIGGACIGDACVKGARTKDTCIRSTCGVGTCIKSTCIGNISAIKHLEIYFQILKEGQFGTELEMGVETG